MRNATRITLASCLAATAIAFSGPAMAQTPTPPTTAAATKQPIPRHMVAEHRNTMTRLDALAKRKGAIGTAAQHVIAVMAPHDQREEAFVLPLLGLMDDLADGKVTPDMAWAVPMADRLIAERGKLNEEHSAIIATIIELTAAGRASHDAKVVAFAEEIAMDETNDSEFIYPAAVVIGRVVREKLAPK